MKLKGGTYEVSPQCLSMFRNPQDFGLNADEFSNLNFEQFAKDKIGGGYKKKTTKKMPTRGYIETGKSKSGGNIKSKILQKNIKYKKQIKKIKKNIKELKKNKNNKDIIIIKKKIIKKILIKIKKGNEKIKKENVKIKIKKENVKIKIKKEKVKIKIKKEKVKIKKEKKK